MISSFDCRMIGCYHTTREPMRSFVDGMTALEGQGGVLSVSLGHGFPWGDVPARRDPRRRRDEITTKREGDALAEKLGP